MVLAGDRGEVGLLLFASDEARAMARADGEVLVGASLRAAVGAALAALAETGTGSSTRVARVLVMNRPPSLEAREITVKGNLNAARVQTARRQLIERLYDDRDPAVIRLEETP